MGEGTEEEVRKLMETGAVVGSMGGVVEALWWML